MRVLSRHQTKAEAVLAPTANSLHPVAYELFWRMALRRTVGKQWETGQIGDLVALIIGGLADAGR